MYQCEKCKNQTVRKTNFCYLCRGKMNPVLKRQACSCGEEIQHYYRFCPNCGKDLAQSPMIRKRMTSIGPRIEIFDEKGNHIGSQG